MQQEVWRSGAGIRCGGRGGKNWLELASPCLLALLRAKKIDPNLNDAEDLHALRPIGD